jgi:ribonucleotide reductase beta subunit family protein with ferritin-like domain
LATRRNQSFKDANDFKDASDAVKHIFTANLLRQTALDSLQGRGS